MNQMLFFQAQTTSTIKQCFLHLLLDFLCLKLSGIDCYDNFGNLFNRKHNNQLIGLEIFSLLYYFKMKQFKYDNLTSSFFFFFSFYLFRILKTKCKNYLLNFQVIKFIEIFFLFVIFFGLVTFSFTEVNKRDNIKDILLL